jgi:hypothetical protein
MSDQDLLALMRDAQPGLPVLREAHVPLWTGLGLRLGLQPPVDPSVRQTDADMSPTIQGDPDSVIGGSKSTMQVWYSTNFPPEARKAFESSLTAWSNTFASPVPVRFRGIWKALDGSTLGATATPVIVPGGLHGSDKLALNTVYVPALAEAVQGTALIPTNDAHVVMVFESGVKWNFDTTVATPQDQVDFATTALHEQCHGLWFSGEIYTKDSQREAVLDSDAGHPGRFDRFLATASGDGTLASCPSPKDLYARLVNNDLRYLDPSSRGVNFSLYAPSSYAVGSSTYHLDGDKLTSDCAHAQISPSDCSDLMTFALEPGYTQRNIGENTRRMMLSQLSASRGVTTQQCSGADPKRSVSETPDGNGAVVEPSSANGPVAGTPRPVSNDGNVNSGTATSNGKLSIPTWAIALIAGLAGLCVVAFVVVVAFKLRSQ